MHYGRQCQYKIPDDLSYQAVTDISLVGNLRCLELRKIPHLSFGYRPRDSMWSIMVGSKSTLYTVLSASPQLHRRHVRRRANCKYNRNEDKSNFKTSYYSDVVGMNPYTVSKHSSCFFFGSPTSVLHPPEQLWNHGGSHTFASLALTYKELIKLKTIRIPVRKLQKRRWKWRIWSRFRKCSFIPTQKLR